MVGRTRPLLCRAARGGPAGTHGVHPDTRAPGTGLLVLLPEHRDVLPIHQRMPRRVDAGGAAASHPGPLAGGRPEANRSLRGMATSRTAVPVVVQIARFHAHRVRTPPEAAKRISCVVRPRLRHSLSERASVSRPCKTASHAKDPPAVMACLHYGIRPVAATPLACNIRGPVFIAEGRLWSVPCIRSGIRWPLEGGDSGHCRLIPIGRT